MGWVKQIALHNVGESECESRSVVSDSLQPHGLYSPWNSPGQNTGVGSHSLLQGIFPTQEPNQGLLHCRWIPYQLSYQGSPHATKTQIGQKVWVRRSSSHLFELWPWFFPAFSFRVKYELFLGLKASSFHTEPYHWLSWSSSLKS